MEATELPFGAVPSVAEPLERAEAVSAMPRLIVLCGLPRSGKSTWARAASAPIVCPDAIRRAVHGQAYNPLAEPWVWATAQTMVRALFAAGHRRVVLDATNTTRERRAMWESREWNTQFVHLTTEAAICTARALAGRRPELVGVIERMAGQWEPFEPGQAVLAVPAIASGVPGTRPPQALPVEAAPAEPLEVAGLGVDEELGAVERAGCKVLEALNAATEGMSESDWVRVHLWLGSVCGATITTTLREALDEVDKYDAGTRGQGGPN